MANIYQSFLKSPSVSFLAPNASLHYITTTTSIHEPEAIIKHLQAQAKQVEKQSENILSSTESSNGICLETETTFKFVRGGGLILPQMDDNMLADMVAVCPMVHVVQLDGNGKISQIRIHWDQATMLKQVEAIGKTGRNWPIKAGQDQTNLVSKSVKAGDQEQARSKPSSSESRASNNQPQSTSARVDSDFHSRLFDTGDVNQGRSNNNGPSVATRKAVKPQPRQWDQLLAGEDDSEPISSSRSPNAKTGAGLNVTPNRLFDKQPVEPRSPSPERKKADPTKYNHFEFGHGEDAPRSDPNRPTSAKAKKQVSNWDFEDFVTPEKVAPRPQREQERHFGYGIDEETPASPPKRPIVHAPRPDARAHFTIGDKSSPAQQSYHDEAPNAKQALGTITNVDNNSRARDAPHFSMNDTSPATTANKRENRDPTAGHKQANDSKARRNNEASWGFDDTPIQTNKIYKTAGDGMGGRAGSRNWALGGDDENDELRSNAYGGKTGQKQVYKTYGNGMGGRKDTGLSWAIGDDDA